MADLEADLDDYGREELIEVVRRQRAAAYGSPYYKAVPGYYWDTRWFYCVLGVLCLLFFIGLFIAAIVNPPA